MYPLPHHMMSGQQPGGHPAAVAAAAAAAMSISQMPRLIEIGKQPTAPPPSAVAPVMSHSASDVMRLQSAMYSDAYRYYETIKRMQEERYKAAGRQATDLATSTAPSQISSATHTSVSKPQEEQEQPKQQQQQPRLATPTGNRVQTKAERKEGVEPGAPLDLTVGLKAKRDANSPLDLTIRTTKRSADTTAGGAENSGDLFSRMATTDVMTSRSSNTESSGVPASAPRNPKKEKLRAYHDRSRSGGGGEGRGVLSPAGYPFVNQSQLEAHLHARNAQYYKQLQHEQHKMHQRIQGQMSQPETAAVAAAAYQSQLARQYAAHYPQLSPHVASPVYSHAQYYSPQSPMAAYLQRAQQQHQQQYQKQLDLKHDGRARTDDKPSDMLNYSRHASYSSRAPSNGYSSARSSVGQEVMTERQKALFGNYQTSLRHSVPRDVTPSSSSSSATERCVTTPQQYKQSPKPLHSPAQPQSGRLPMTNQDAQMSNQRYAQKMIGFTSPRDQKSETTGGDTGEKDQSKIPQPSLNPEYSVLAQRLQGQSSQSPASRVIGSAGILPTSLNQAFTTSVPEKFLSGGSVSKLDHVDAHTEIMNRIRMHLVAGQEHKLAEMGRVVHKAPSLVDVSTKASESLSLSARPGSPQMPVLSPHRKSEDIASSRPNGKTDQANPPLLSCDSVVKVDISPATLASSSKFLFDVKPSKMAAATAAMGMSPKMKLKQEHRESSVSSSAIFGDGSSELGLPRESTLRAALDSEFYATRPDVYPNLAYSSSSPPGGAYSYKTSLEVKCAADAKNTFMTCIQNSIRETLLSNSDDPPGKRPESARLLPEVITISDSGSDKSFNNLPSTPKPSNGGRVEGAGRNDGPVTDLPNEEEYRELLRCSSPVPLVTETPASTASTSSTTPSTGDGGSGLDYIPDKFRKINKHRLLSKQRKDETRIAEKIVPDVSSAAPETGTRKPGLVPESKNPSKKGFKRSVNESDASSCKSEDKCYIENGRKRQRRLHSKGASLVPKKRKYRDDETSSLGGEVDLHDKNSPVEAKRWKKSGLAKRTFNRHGEMSPLPEQETDVYDTAVCGNSDEATPIGSGHRAVPALMRRMVVNKNSGETVLHRAARLSYEDVMLYCLETGYVDVNVRDNAGYTPLHECAVRGHITVAMHLIKFGADVNCSAMDGTRPMHDAVDHDNIEFVRLLLSYGADPLLATYGGKVPLKIARSEIMKNFFKAYLKEINGGGEDNPWCFYGSTLLADNDVNAGCNVFADLPTDPEDNDHEFQIELSNGPLPASYQLYFPGDSSRANNYVFLNDVITQLSMTKADFQTTYPSVDVKRLLASAFKRQAQGSAQVVLPECISHTGKRGPLYVEVVHLNCVRDILSTRVACVDYLKDREGNESRSRSTSSRDAPAGGADDTIESLKFPSPRRYSQDSTHSTDSKGSFTKRKINCSLAKRIVYEDDLDSPEKKDCSKPTFFIPVQKAAQRKVPASAAGGATAGADNEADSNAHTNAKSCVVAEASSVTSGGVKVQSKVAECGAVESTVAVTHVEVYAGIKSAGESTLETDMIKTADKKPEAQTVKRAVSEEISVTQESVIDVINVTEPLHRTSGTCCYSGCNELIKRSRPDDAEGGGRQCVVGHVDACVESNAGDISKVIKEGSSCRSGSGDSVADETKTGEKGSPVALDTHSRAFYDVTPEAVESRNKIDSKPDAKTDAELVSGADRDTSKPTIHYRAATSDHDFTFNNGSPRLPASHSSVVGYYQNHFYNNFLPSLSNGKDLSSQNQQGATNAFTQHQYPHHHLHHQYTSPSGYSVAAAAAALQQQSRTPSFASHSSLLPPPPPHFYSRHVQGAPPYHNNPMHTAAAAYAAAVSRSQSATLTPAQLSKLPVSTSRAANSRADSTSTPPIVPSSSYAYSQYSVPPFAVKRQDKQLFSSGSSSTTTTTPSISIAENDGDHNFNQVGFSLQTDTTSKTPPSEEKQHQQIQLNHLMTRTAAASSSAVGVVSMAAALNDGQRPPNQLSPNSGAMYNSIRQMHNIGREYQDYSNCQPL